MSLRRVAWLAVAPLLLLSACSFSGACVSTGGSPEECKQDWDQADCDDFDANNVNGATWTFYPGQTCADRGFTSTCSADPYSYCH